MSIFRINGNDLFVETQGDGEPVLFVNGIMMTSRVWTPQTSVLAKSFTCVTYDLRGQLLSDKPDGVYGWDQHVADCLGVLDALEIGSAHIVGNSYGGVIAQLMAARHPGRIRSLSVIGSLGRADARFKAIFDRWAEVVAREPRDVAAATREDNFSAAYLRDNAAAIAKSEAWFRQQDDAYFRALKALIPAIRDVDILDELARIRCPAQMLVGGEDALVGDGLAEEAARHIPGCRLTVIEGAGHAVSLEQPAVVNQTLLDFLFDA